MITEEEKEKKVHLYIISENPVILKISYESGNKRKNSAMGDGF